MPNESEWEEAIQKDHGLELHIIEREEIITLMMMPENASLCASFLHLDIDAEPQIADLIDRTRRAATPSRGPGLSKTKGHPLIELTAVRLDPNGAESTDVLSLEQIDQALSQSRRIVLEGPAGRGKTTTLIQLAQRAAYRRHTVHRRTSSVDVVAPGNPRIHCRHAGVPGRRSHASGPRARAADRTFPLVVKRLE